MNLTKEFTMYVKENNIDIDRKNFDEHLKVFKDKLVAETEEMEMCNHELSIGDWVKVQIVSNGHLNGGRLEGKIVAFYPHIPQVKLESGWCFHPTDEILIHKPLVNDEPNPERSAATEAK